MHPLRFRSPLLVVAISFAMAGHAQTPVQNSAAAPSKTSCPVDRTLPNEGELALARKDYPAADAFFSATIKLVPNSEGANFGLVRALIGENNVAEASSRASAMLAQHPQSALAEVAVAEAAYRAADFDEALSHALLAIQKNPCEGRGYAIAAKGVELSAMFARYARYLATAHSLRPTDEIIRRQWINSLPSKQRAVELSLYLNGANALSEEDRNGLNNAVEHIKAHRPGECRITSKADTVKIPFRPIYGDSQSPRAYGLDVILNGKKRRMQIDTGASGIVLTPGAAKRLGIEPEYRIKTEGVGDAGKVGSFLAHVEKIQIGDVEVSDCMVDVLDKGNLDVDGLIGIDVFERWLVTLDYQNAQLLLGPLPPRPAADGTSAPTVLADSGEDEHPPRDRYIAPEMKDWLRVARIGHELLLPARLNKGPIHFLMADTGASRSTLSPAFAKGAGKIVEDSNIRFSGISGEVKKVYRVDNAALQFGALGLPPTSYFVFDLTSVSHATGAEISGFVGLPTLSRLTISIDYRDNLMQLKYDPKHDIQKF